jgi:hypothetical protein
MISKEEMGTLIGRKGKPGHPVLSVYLDVDQSRETNLNRKFEVSLGNLLRELEQGLVNQSEREEYAADAERMRRFVSNYRPGARSLVIFCDALRGDMPFIACCWPGRWRRQDSSNICSRSNGSRVSSPQWICRWNRINIRCSPRHSGSPRKLNGTEKSG